MMVTSDSHSKVAAVVVTWNRRDLLKQCLDCLLKQEGANCDILVIDNNSTDGTGDFIAAEYALPQLHYFNTGFNLGGAGGFMCGIDAAAQMGYDRIWIMDDDCLPHKTALAELLKADRALEGNWGFLCSAIYWTDGEICRFNRPKKDVFRHIDAVDYQQALVPAKMTSFVSVMFRADVVREGGLPIAEYFIWTDDYEYTGRISKRYPSYVVPPSKMTHTMKENARPSLATEDESRIERFYYLSRNDVHCYRQHGIMGHAYLIVKAAYTALDIAVHAKASKAERLGVLTKGSMDGIVFNPEVPMVYDGVDGFRKAAEAVGFESSSNVSTAKIAILSTQTTRVIPYVKLYEDALDGKAFDLIYWDRHGYKDNDERASRIYRYGFAHSSDSAKLEGIGGYIGFSRYASEIVRRNKYDKLIILQVQTGVTICHLLVGALSGSYILDIRDYSYERFASFRAIEKSLIEKSYRTVISSAGFKAFLPEHDYTVVHNIPTTMPKRVMRKSASRPFVITYSGCIHYYDQNIKLIDLFANDERFIFRFIGEGAETLQEYVDSKSIGNVIIKGAYKPGEEASIYETTDVISNAYGSNDPLLDYALANKLYLAMAYRKPILVSKGTYSAQLAIEVGVGFIIDFEDPECKDKLVTFVEQFNYEAVAESCYKALSAFK